VATFEAWDPAGRTFDAVIAGQAWHWVDPAAGAVKAAQVLRPGGRLAAFWNAGQFPPEATAAFGAVYAEVAPGSLAARGFRRAVSALDGYAMLFAMAADGIRSAARSANRSSGCSTGSTPTPATSGWISCPPKATTASSRRLSWPSWSHASEPPSTRWEAASQCSTPR